MDRDSQDGHPDLPEGTEPREVLLIAPGETMCLGDHIKVRVLEVHGDEVRLEIIAPPGVKVARGPQQH